MNRQFDRNWQQTVRDGALSFGVELSQEQLDLLTFHAKELIKWNKKFNITAIVDPFEVALKHFIDSIAIAPIIQNGSKVIDLGSGGGFPGMPLKVVNPFCDVVMVDSSQKKVNFLNYIISQTSLIEKELIEQIKVSGIKAIHCRAEELSKIPKYANQFDFVVSRAFTALNNFIDMALPFLKSNGTVIAMKGELKPEELAPIYKLNNLDIYISEYFLPFEHHKRCVVSIKKSK